MRQRGGLTQLVGYVPGEAGVVQVIVDSMAWVTRPDASSKNVLTLET